MQVVRSATADSSGNRIAGSSAWRVGSGSWCEQAGTGGSTEPVEVASCH